MLQSSIVNSISHRNKTIDIPHFLATAMINLSTEVRSRNKVAGFTSGSMSSSFTWSEKHRVLSALSDDDINDIFSKSVFSRICSDNKLFNEFKVEFGSLLETVNPTGNTDGDVDELINFLRSMTDIFMFNSKGPLPNFFGTISESITSKIGVYRFRKAAYNGITYICSQSSVSVLQEPTVNYLFCFLRIFKPTFFFNGEYENSTSLILPGEGLYDLTEVNVQMCWECFLGTKSLIQSGRTQSALSGYYQTDDNIEESFGAKNSKIVYPKLLRKLTGIRVYTSPIALSYMLDFSHYQTTKCIE
jgi:hypothetical protein